MPLTLIINRISVLHYSFVCRLTVNLNRDIQLVCSAATVEMVCVLHRSTGSGRGASGFVVMGVIGNVSELVID